MGTNQSDGYAWRVTLRDTHPHNDAATGELCDRTRKNVLKK